MQKVNFNFLVLIVIIALGVAASCNQTGEQESEKSEIQTVAIIPFEITEGNNIKFQALLNGIDTLSMFFDTGGTELVMLESKIPSKKSLFSKLNEPVEEMPVFENNSFALGGLEWDSITVYPYPVGPEEMDGHFGWNLFENKIVELNYETQELMVHTELPENLEGYAKMEIEYTHTLFCIQASINVGGQNYPERYLFDTGFQRAVVMDKDLRLKNNFPTNLPVISESKLKNSRGDVFINQVVKADQFCFENICADDVPIQLFDAPNPARFETHILGGELLMRFNTILDFKNHHVYLKPNLLIGKTYVDAT